MSQKENYKVKDNNKAEEKENKEPSDLQIPSSLDLLTSVVSRVQNELNEQEQKPRYSKSFGNSERNAPIDNPPRPMFSNGTVFQRVNNLEERKYVSYQEWYRAEERSSVIKKIGKPRKQVPLILQKGRKPRVSTRDSHVFKVPKIYECEYCGKIVYHIARLMTHMRNHRIRY